MNLLYLLVLLVPFCVGEPPSCCMPRQVTYNTRTLSSSIDPVSNGLHSFESTGKVYMDYDNKKRLNIVDKTENGRTYRVISYTDYNTGKTYEVTKGHCVEKSALLINGSMSDNCFPGHNAGNSYIGREMMGDTVTDVWRTNLVNSHGFMVVMHVSAKDCTLMAETDYGSIQGVPTQSTTFMSDVITHIEDQNVFVVPTQCWKQPAYKVLHK